MSRFSQILRRQLEMGVFPSIAAMAEHLGVKFSTFCHWLYNKREPSLKVQKSICKKLKLPESFVYRGPLFTVLGGGGLDLKSIQRAFRDEFKVDRKLGMVWFYHAVTCVFYRITELSEKLDLSMEVDNSATAVISVRNLEKFTDCYIQLLPTPKGICIKLSGHPDAFGPKSEIYLTERIFKDITAYVLKSKIL